MTIWLNTADKLRDYFSGYGSVVDYQIMIDHKTGRSRGFGFITFENEDAVENIFAEGKIHKLGGKQVCQKSEKMLYLLFNYASEIQKFLTVHFNISQVEIKRAQPRKCGGGLDDAAARCTGYDSGGWYTAEMGTGYGWYDVYDAYNNYGGNYGGGYAGFCGGYGGYAFGYGYGYGPMYGIAGFGANGYGFPGGYSSATAYGGGNSKGYGNGFVGRGSGSGGGNGSYDNGGGSMTGRYHPYFK